MRRENGWGRMTAAVGLLGMATAARAAEVTIEIERRLAPQQVQVVREAVHGLGDVQKVEVERDQLEATVQVATISTAALHDLLAVLRNTGVPFEVKLEQTDLTPDEIAALQDQVAGLPAEVTVEVEDGVQEIEIDVERGEHQDHREVERLEEPGTFELAERPEEIERPEREAIERPDVDDDAFDD